MGRVLTEEQFDEEFKPIDHPDGGYFWGLLKDVQTSGVPGDRVWSAADGETEHTILMPGYHVVNVFAWVITEVPWTDEMDIEYVDLGRGGDHVELKHEEMQAVVTLITHFLESDEALDEDKSDDPEFEDYLNYLDNVKDELEEVLRAVSTR